MKNKTKIVLNEIETEMLNEFLIFCMVEMMSINTQNRFAKEPFLTEEEAQCLKEKMDYCQLFLKKLRHAKKQEKTNELQ